jgi:hypothetical protein
MIDGLVVIMAMAAMAFGQSIDGVTGDMDHGLALGQVVVGVAMAVVATDYMAAEGLAVPVVAA